MSNIILIWPFEQENSKSTQRQFHSTPNKSNPNLILLMQLTNSSSPQVNFSQIREITTITDSKQVINSQWKQIWSGFCKPDQASLKSNTFHTSSLLGFQSMKIYESKPVASCLSPVVTLIRLSVRVTLVLVIINIFQLHNSNNLGSIN